MNTKFDLVCIRCGSVGRVTTELVTSEIGYMMDRHYLCSGCDYMEILRKEIRVDSDS